MFRTHRPSLPRISQSPTDPAFVQNPYAFYARARALGPLVWWDEYGMACTTTFEATNAALRHRRMGRTPVEPPRIEPHTAPFYAIEARSMLELEPPRHTRLRGLVLKAFTTRGIASMAPQIEQLCHALIDAFPAGPFDLLPAYCAQVPVIVIARLLGVPEAMAPDLLRWSHAMVGMYQARRTRAMEEAAARAATEFADFLRGYVNERRKHPADDLITRLIAAEEDGARLSSDELIATCILLLNAGHEATVHTLGNGVKALLDNPEPEWREPARMADTVEEILRHDPPLHMFTRHVYEDMIFCGHELRRGDRIGCLLGAAAHDPAETVEPERFDPARNQPRHLSFGAGIHFCVGAPLARLELAIALRILFERCPNLRLAETPRYADLYHFHGLESLRVQA